MKKNVNNVVAALFSPSNRSKIFYILAFVPFVLMFYFSAEFHLASVVTLYGYIILVIKKPKLFSRPGGSAIQKVFGLVVVLASFFVYYIASPFFPNAVFYGFANYSLYIIGLFLLFFHVKVLKEALSPLFLVGASFLGSFFSDLTKSYFEVYLPNFTSFIASILRTIGIATQHPSSDPNTITMLYTVQGPISLGIGWGCVGFVGVFLFSVILIVIMLEDPSSPKTKVIWSVIGVSGMFFVNLIRIVTIFVGFYFYGYDFDKVHLYLGYILFITWSVIFFYLFSKRNVISQKIRMIRVKI